MLNENSNLSALVYENRKVVRDSALASFDRVIALVVANSFTTLPNWSDGPTYTNVDVGRIANTMASVHARQLAPRQCRGDRGRLGRVS